MWTLIIVLDAVIFAALAVYLFSRGLVVPAVVVLGFGAVETVVVRYVAERQMAGKKEGD